MKITNEQYQKIAKYLPSNVKISHLQLINAILYVAENSCKLMAFYSNWHTVYVRLNRWSKNGFLERFFAGLIANFTPLVEENKFLLMDRVYQDDNMRLSVKIAWL